MTSKQDFLLIIFLTFFVLVLSYFLSYESYIIFALPFVFSVVYFGFFNFQSLFFFIAFLTPLSMSLIDLGFTNLSIGMAFPTEPILFGLLLLVVFQLIYKFSLFKRTIKHPITTCVLLYLFWMFVTCCTSSMPLVSFKLFISRLWYIFPIFFMGVFLFKYSNNIFKFVLAYSFSLFIVILYTIIRHSNFLFDKQSAHYMMSPFFNDHTSYGAVIAFVIPLLVSAFFVKRHKFLIRLLILSIFMIFCVGLVLSFTRAAWISLLISLICVVFIRFKVNKSMLFFTPLIGIFLFFMFQDALVQKLSSNKQDSSDNLVEHFSSLSNISTDASNMERINRWNCAFQMFSEKPFFGWGPGTYQFNYARFQMHKDRTIISSNHGDMGNAHSEYLGPLAESGFFGLFFFLIMILVILIRAVNLFYETKNQTVQIWLLGIITSILSYFIHGLFNNFLDTDKASVPLWAVIAMIVSFELFYKNTQFPNKEQLFQDKIS